MVYPLREARPSANAFAVCPLAFHSLTRSRRSRARNACFTQRILVSDGDRYLVSNINGGALAEDNNGFVSVLSPDGQVTTLKWIEGGKNKVSLDGPKGLRVARRRPLRRSSRRRKGRGCHAPTGT